MEDWSVPALNFYFALPLHTILQPKHLVPVCVSALSERSCLAVAQALLDLALVNQGICLSTAQARAD